MASAHDRTLEGIRLLAGLPPEVRRQLETMCGWRRFARGEQIIGQQDRSGEVFLIVRGAVRVLVHSITGRQIAFGDKAEGDHFGELAAIDGGPRAASVVALTSVTLATMSGALFVDMVKRHPDLGLAVMRDLTATIRGITHRVVALSTQDAHSRVRAELLRLAQISANGAAAVAIQPLPHHAEIAARVGTTRETVTRVLAELARLRLVERRGHALVVLDLDRFVAMVEQTPAVQSDLPIDIGDRGHRFDENGRHEPGVAVIAVTPPPRDSR